MIENNIISFLNENGFLDKKSFKDFSNTEKINSDILIKIFTTMIKTKLIDEKTTILQRQGLITFAMSSRGEEGAIVASCAALDYNDWIYPQYREHGAILYRGLTTEQFLHTMFCNSKDEHLGRQMPVHFGSKKLNVVTVSSPLTTQLPQSVGCSYAFKNKNKIALTYFGEGAASEGDFHAALNFASVLNTPTIFFCRNNNYAISTPSTQQFAAKNISQRGPAYNIKTFTIDGNDIFAVYSTVKNAREYAVTKNKPVLIEAMTYRLSPHSTSDDPSKYRPKEEETLNEKYCSIKRLEKYLLNEKIITKEEIKNITASIKEEIDLATDIAKSTPPPAIKTLIEDVYCKTPVKLERQLEKVLEKEGV